MFKNATLGKSFGVMLGLAVGLSFSSALARDHQKNVGSWAQFKVLETDTRGKTLEMTQILKVLSYSVDSDKYTVSNTTVYPDGNSISAEFDIDSDWLIDEDQAAAIVENCEAEGGTKEVLNHPTPNFNTCKKHMDDNTTLWFAPVPFGNAQAEYRDRGTITTTQIEKFGH